MIYGMFHWLNHYDYKTQKVNTRILNKLQRVLVFVGTALLTVGLYSVLTTTDDTQPFVDAVTTIPAFVAQILMIKRYKDSWYYWLIIDVGSIIMWAIAGDWCMVAQFALWTGNCIYGLKNW
jgi:nicotinamide mononucleotide transporter PnuC